MGRTNSPEPLKSEPLVLHTWRSITHEAYDEMVEEMQRLHKVESAALALLATMPRRDGKPYSFTAATMPKIVELDATLQQPEEDDNG